MIVVTVLAVLMWLAGPLIRVEQAASGDTLLELMIGHTDAQDEEREERPWDL